MIRLALRLAVAGGREAAVRLVIIAAAVAIGTGMLLSTLAGLNAVHTQNGRYAWLNTGFAENPATTTPAAAHSAWWLERADYFRGEAIARVDVAATGPGAPAPPGIPRLPGPGEYYASPAMATLLDTAPADQLAGRYAGRRAGVIGRAGLPAPTSRVVIVGDTVAHLSRQPYAHKVDRIETVDPSKCRGGCVAGTPADGIGLILAVVAAALLFPLLMFVGTATRLSAARREQRFAAMRLVGATPRQISVIAAAEASVAAVAGTLAGFGVFAALRPALATLPFTGEPFFLSDLSLRAADVAAVALGIPLAAAGAAWSALRRVRISPLGVSRRVTPRPPRAWRLTLAALGVAELAFFVGRPPQTTNGQIVAYLAGIFTIMIGLVAAGPWLTMVGARLLARRATRPATLIAGRRLSDNPQAGFRAVSGLMLALFVTAVATGVITTLVVNRTDPPGNSPARTALSRFFWPEDQARGGTRVMDTAVPGGLRSIPGVRAVLVTYLNPRFRIGGRSDAEPALIACADLAAHPEFGTCPRGARVAGVQPGLVTFENRTSLVWSADPATPDRLDRQPIESIVVATDGRDVTIDRARTLLERAFPDGDPPSTEREWQSQFSRALSQWQQLANVVILATLPIAGCSLAVSVVAGLTERRRPFSLLRLAGVRLAVLRAVVALESAVPLLLVAAFATGMGFLAAHLFLEAQLGYALRSPGPSYWAIVVTGLVVSLGIIASTLPLLGRITGPETARNE